MSPKATPTQERCHPEEVAVATDEGSAVALNARGGSKPRLLPDCQQTNWDAEIRTVREEESPGIIPSIHEIMDKMKFVLEKPLEQTRLGS
jgi:hypothetical protein